MKKCETSHELFYTGAFGLFKHAVLVTLPVVFVASFLRGSSFELLNVMKALAFICFSWGTVSYIAMYFIVRKSIQLGEVKDDGIIFRK